MTTGARELFNSVIAASGLSPIFAPGTIKRALEDVGASPLNATAETYLRALPGIEARMRAFHDATELRTAVTRIRAVLAQHGARGPNDT